MRVWSRIALVVVLLVSAATLSADHYIADCPLSLVDSTPAATDFDLSPHGVFRSGSLVFVLRGQLLTTYTSSDVGNLRVLREDFVSSMAARETEGGAAFSAGFLFLSSEAGLEIYDLRNAQNSAPVLISRTGGLHYRRLAVNNNRLAGLYPSTDLPCYPDGSDRCANQIDLFDITNLTAPVKIGSISSRAAVSYRGFNDIAFNYGYLMAVSEEALVAFDITNPALPVRWSTAFTPGQWLVSNGSDFIAVGTDSRIDAYTVRPGMLQFFSKIAILTIPQYLAIETANPIRFSRYGYWDETNGRLITMVDEVNPMTLKAARTMAFDVFDFTVPRLEGSVERIYEDVTLTTDDEVKFNPVAVGPLVYVIGQSTGLQSYGACGRVTGRIELDSPLHLTCGGGEIHGWVTGTQKIGNVELFLDDTSLGSATLGGPLRYEVSATTPVTMWRLGVNLDATARGEHLLRAVGTDALGNRSQFAFSRLFFPGPGENCTTPRRRAIR